MSVNYVVFLCFCVLNSSFSSVALFPLSFYRLQIFTGNNDADEEALNIFDLPLFARYIRIHPLGWINDIALRLELLGCNTQQGA